MIGRRLIIRGFTTSYYIKQLAIQGLLEGVGARMAMEIELEIQVSNSQPADAE